MSVDNADYCFNYSYWDDGATLKLQTKLYYPLRLLLLFVGYKIHQRDLHMIALTMKNQKFLIARVSVSEASFHNGVCSSKCGIKQGWRSGELNQEFLNQRIEAAWSLTKEKFSYKEKFVVKRYEDGINKTCTIETIVNLLQVFNFDYEFVNFVSSSDFSYNWNEWQIKTINEYTRVLIFLYMRSRTTNKVFSFQLDI